MEDKYTTLTLVSSIYKSLGVALIGLSIILAFLFLILVTTQHETSTVPFYTVGITLVIGLFGSLMAFTTGKLITLFMDIEKNTRK